MCTLTSSGSHRSERAYPAQILPAKSLALRMLHHGMHNACLMYLLAQATTAVSGPVRRFSLPLLCNPNLIHPRTLVVLGACWIYLLAQV